MCAAIVSVACAVVGILLSILVSTPVGATIVVVDVGVFAVFTLIGGLKRG